MTRNTKGEILNNVLVTHFHEQVLQFSLHIIDPVPGLLGVMIEMFLSSHNVGMLKCQIQKRMLRNRNLSQSHWDFQCWMNKHQTTAFDESQQLKGSYVRYYKKRFFSHKRVKIIIAITVLAFTPRDNIILFIISMLQLNLFA